MRKHASLILTLIAAAAFLFAWSRSSQVRALKTDYDALVSKRSALPVPPAAVEESTSPVPVADPALEDSIAALRRVIEMPGHIHSPGKNKALMKWLGNAAVSLSASQLVQLAAAVLQSVPGRP